MLGKFNSRNYSLQDNPGATQKKDQSALDKRMAKIIERGQQESGDQDIAGAGMSANAAVHDYLSRPLCKDTFEFWKKYGHSTEKAQRCLSELARVFLTPPPTTTGIHNFVVLWNG